jgi:hypothetical protein
MEMFQELRVNFEKCTITLRIACAAPTDYRFLIFCRSRAAGFSSTLVN